MTEVSAREEKSLNIRRSVTLENCFGGEETQETIEEGKCQDGSSVPVRKEEKTTRKQSYI